jgi:polyhydroxybutyrate depolymerase
MANHGSSARARHRGPQLFGAPARFTAAHAVAAVLLVGAVLVGLSGVLPTSGWASAADAQHPAAGNAAVAVAPRDSVSRATYADVDALPAPAAPAVPVPAPAPAQVAPTVSRLTATLGGLERAWVLVAPPTRPGPVDLVLALHGVGADGSQMRGLGLDSLAMPDDVAVAFPDAAYGAWNDGRPGADVLSPDGRGADDIAFLRTVIERSGVAMLRPVRSVGVVGFSNGAMMAARVACEMSDVVSVVAIVAGSAPEGFQNGCRPVHPVSVAVVAAKGDPVVPFNGGQVAPFLGRPRGRVSGVDATVAFWATADACHATETPPTSPAAPAVGATESASCDATRHVARYATDDAAHEWRRAGGFDTTTVVWSFVRSELPRLAGTDDLARAGLPVLG